MSYPDPPQTPDERTKFEIYFERIFREPASEFTIMAAILSFVSLGTTVAGFALLFGEWVVFALILGIAFQYFLFTFAMDLGRALNGITKGVVKNTTHAVAFLLLLIVSSGFSAAFFWDQVFTGEEEQRTLAANVRNGVAAEIERMAAARDEEGQALRTSVTEDVTEWRAVFDELSEIGEQAQTSLDDALQTRIDAATNDLETARAELDELRTRNTEGDRLAADAQILIPQLEAQISALQSEINGLIASRTQAQTRFNEARILHECTITGCDGTPPGCGPVCNSAKQEMALAQSNIDQLTSRIDTATENLGSAQSELLTARNRAGTPDDGTDLTQAIATQRGVVGDLDANLAELRREKSARQGGGADPLQSAYANLLARPSVANYQTALQRCRDALEVYRKPNSGVADQVGAQSCDNTVLRASVIRLDAFNKSGERFIEECGEQSAGVQALPAVTREKALEYGQSCVTLAGLTSTRANIFREGLSDLDNRNSTDANLFTRVSNAYSQRELSLVFATVSALSIDLLILLCGYVAPWRREKTIEEKIGSEDYANMQLEKRWKLRLEVEPGDPQEIRYVKALLGLLNPRMKSSRDTKAFTYETNYTDLKAALVKGQALESFNARFGPWIKEYGRIEGEPPHEVLMVRDEFVNYFVKELYEFQKTQGLLPDWGNGAGAQGAGAPIMIGHDAAGDPIGRAPRPVGQSPTPTADPQTPDMGSAEDVEIIDAVEVSDAKQEDGARRTAAAFLKGSRG